MRVKRVVEGVISLLSMLLVVYVVHVYLQLILMGRDPPTQLAALALAAILGVIGSALKAEDVKEALSILAEIPK